MKLLKYVNYNELRHWSVNNLLLMEELYKAEVEVLPLGKVLKKTKTEKIKVEDNKRYAILGIKSYGKGIYINKESYGKDLRVKYYQNSIPNNLAWYTSNNQHGAFGVITEEFRNTYITSNITLAKIDTDKINPMYLQTLFKLDKFIKYTERFNIRRAIPFKVLMEDVLIPTPSLEKQEKMVDKFNWRINLAEHQERRSCELEREISNFLFKELKIENVKGSEPKKQLLDFINHSQLSSWNVLEQRFESKYQSQLLISKTLNENIELYVEILKGIRPEYSEKSEIKIINQSSNGINSIDLENSKTIDESCAKSVSQKKFTKEGDILINSIGKEIIGRATYITKEYEGFLYDSNVLLLRVNKNKINPLYLTFFLNSKIGKEEIKRIMPAGIPRIRIFDLKNFKLLIPDLKLQNKIVKKLEELNEEKSKSIELSKKSREIAALEFENEIFL